MYPTRHLFTRLGAILAGLAFGLVTSIAPAAVQSISQGQTAPISVTAGQSVTLSVSASGTAPFGYQWKKDGVDILGATSATLTITNATTANSGAYSVVVSNDAGTATSGSATINVSAAPTVTAPSITAQPKSAAVTTGGTASFSVSASGTAPFTYQWRKNGVNIPGATDSSLSLTNVQSTSAGAYSVVVTNSAGSATSTDASLTVSSGSQSGSGGSGNTGGGSTGGSNGTITQQNRLAGLASRCFVGTGADIAISGFIVSGTQPKRLLIRGTGPGLSAYGLGGAMQTPVMTVFAGSDEIARNESWKATNAQDIRDANRALNLNAMPEDGRDCAIVATFNPGAYTVQLSDKNGQNGVGLIEVYDLDAAGSNGLIGISTRAAVGQGGDILITGLVVTGSAPKTVLLRALGPSLASLGLGGCLQNPVIKVFAGSTEIASNTVWGTSPKKAEIAAATAKIGLFAIDANSNDSAILATFQPGAYTIQVSGLNNSTGVALLEAYEVPASP